MQHLLSNQGYALRSLRILNMLIKSADIRKLLKAGLTAASPSPSAQLSGDACAEAATSIEEVGDKHKDGAAALHGEGVQHQPGGPSLQQPRQSAGMGNAR